MHLPHHNTEHMDTEHGTGSHTGQDKGFISRPAYIPALEVVLRRPCAGLGASQGMKTALKPSA